MWNCSAIAWNIAGVLSLNPQNSIRRSNNSDSSRAELLPCRLAQMVFTVSVMSISSVSSYALRMSLYRSR